MRTCVPDGSHHTCSDEQVCRAIHTPQPERCRDAGGRIPGSVNVPFPELFDEQGRLRSPAELREILDSVGALDPDVTPVTYCGGGIAATTVAFALNLVGREDVAVYDGSLNAWTADETRPLEKD